MMLSCHWQIAVEEVILVGGVFDHDGFGGVKLEAGGGVLLDEQRFDHI